MNFKKKKKQIEHKWKNTKFKMKDSNIKKINDKDKDKKITTRNKQEK